MINPNQLGYFVILSDTHSNLPALEAVWAWMQSCPESIEGFVSLGDQIGYGPFPQETLDLFAKMADAFVDEKGINKAMFLRGNHEAAVWDMEDLSRWNPHAVRQVAWTKAQIKDDSILMDDSDPVEAHFEIQTPLGKVVLVHDNPMYPGSGDYVFSQWGAVTCFNSKDFQVCFYGHTHYPKLYRKVDFQVKDTSFEPGVRVELEDHRWMINPGSVGQPRDNDPRASFALYHPLEGHVTIVRLEYDVERTVQAVLESPLDDQLGLRLREGH